MEFFYKKIYKFDEVQKINFTDELTQLLECFKSSKGSCVIYVTRKKSTFNPLPHF
jgi:hypothetical protein